jgi:hypothetical protein
MSGLAQFKKDSDGVAATMTRLWVAGEKQREIGALFEVSESTVCQMIRQFIDKHAPEADVEANLIYHGERKKVGRVAFDRWKNPRAPSALPMAPPRP